MQPSGIHQRQPVGLPPMRHQICFAQIAPLLGRARHRQRMPRDDDELRQRKELLVETATQQVHWRFLDPPRGRGEPRVPIRLDPFAHVEPVIRPAVDEMLIGIEGKASRRPGLGVMRDRALQVDAFIFWNGRIPDRTDTIDRGRDPCGQRRARPMQPTDEKITMAHGCVVLGRADHMHLVRLAEKSRLGTHRNMKGTDIRQGALSGETDIPAERSPRCS